MRKFFAIAVGVIFLYCLYLCAFSVLHGEVNFFNDIARDFLLLIELDQKKIVFIGPRSSTAGLFYGSFMTYLNYPSWVLGHGDPVVVAWFWIFLIIIFALTSFLIVRKLFGELAAAIYVILVSLKLATHANAVFEPVAIYLFMPAFLFTILEYQKTKKWPYLAGHMLALSAFVQLSPGIGLQFLILSIPLIIYLIYKNKKWNHLATFFVLPLGISNLILFDIKHSFTMSKALIGTGGTTKFFITIQSWISNRFENLVSLSLFDGNNNYLILSGLIFLVVMYCSFQIIRSDKSRKPTFLTIIFYYIGYFILSYFNKGILLVHYVYLLIPFTIFWLVSFLDSKYKNIFILILVVVFMLNLGNVLSFNNSILGFSGHDPNSWKGLSKVGERVAQLQKGKPFGYFVFAPDSYAYQPRYAMIYSFRNSEAHEYEKLATTYVIAQPPPVDDQYMDYKWWVKEPLGITKKPSEIIDMPDGYKILKFELNSDERKVPHDKTIELGIHFR